MRIDLSIYRHGSGELKVGDWSSIPGGMLLGPPQARQLSQAGLIYEPLLLALPQKLLALLGEGAQTMFRLGLTRRSRRWSGGSAAPPAPR
jgi:hypothetical protein